MSLKSQLTEDFKSSMKNKQAVRKSVITLLRAEIKQFEVDKRIDADDEQVISIIAKQLKQRKEALQEFKKAEREDLITQTEEEIKILTAYLPEQLNDADLENSVKSIIESVGATSMKDMGKVMAEATKKLKGRADGARINTLVKKILSK